ncbi:hypothetical protein [Cryobacterium aureum]|uniref:hypothetical protein n=1 Tax=Cryobacterium aureum TaxID=995037 RepID=UPI000CF50604|nr:hypothetical protein [Cryobacterium aureum]
MKPTSAGDVINVLMHTRVLPVLTVHDAGSGDAIAAGLGAGGLPIAEVTLRTPAALDAIRGLAIGGEVLVGAGTVLSIDDAQRAVDAGARFLVSPGLSESLAMWCQTNGIAFIPGVVQYLCVIPGLNSLD